VGVASLALRRKPQRQLITNSHGPNLVGHCVGKWLAVRRDELTRAQIEHPGMLAVLGYLREFASRSVLVGGEKRGHAHPLAQDRQDRSKTRPPTPVDEARLEPAGSS
jgi:hypothetical protein